MLLKKIAKPLGLIAFGLFLALLLAEAGLRLLHIPGSIYATDPKTGLMVLNPNSTFVYRKSCFNNLVKTNSFGFHDAQITLEKPANTTRIAVLGDSFVESLQVPLEKTFYNRLEQMLNQEYSDRKFEVIGLGKSGNGTYNDYRYYLKYGSRFSPDLVVDALLVGNDLRDDSSQLTGMLNAEANYTASTVTDFPQFDERGQLIIPEPKRAEPSPIYKQILKKSAVLVQAVRLVREFMSKRYYTKQTENQKAREENAIIVDNQVYLKEYPQVWEEAWKTEEELLRTFSVKVEENRSKFLLVSLTEEFRVTQTQSTDQRLDYGKPEQLLQKISEEQSFSYLALLPAFQKLYKETGKDPHFSCDGHWNETGHEWAAQTIFDYLKMHPELLQPQS